MSQKHSRSSKERHQSKNGKNEEIKICIQQIVKAYRLKQGENDQPLSYAKFARKLEESVRPSDFGVSHQSVKNWEAGVYYPDLEFVIQLYIHAPKESWQRSFAIDILSIQYPGLYQPASEIGESISSRRHQN